VHSRLYNNSRFIYATPKEKGAGAYQEFNTEIGKTYKVSAILIGSDTNRLKNFNGYSYLTISDKKPTASKVNVYSESEKVLGGVEKEVNFIFTATSAKTSLALRSDNR
jgi:hypothetical protein